MTYNPNTYLEYVARINKVYDDPKVTGRDNCQYDACVIIPDHITDFHGEVGIQDLPGGLCAIYHYPWPVGSSAIENAYIDLYRWIAINGYIPEESRFFAVYLSNPHEAVDGITMINICVNVSPM